MSNKKSTKQSGFTLVELAIVLVIIGLIVSGVLVGQDLIRAAEIRSTLSQLERYNTSVNAFRDKYRYLPGDLGLQAATNFGFETTGRDATTNDQSDQDARLECGQTACATIRAFGGETALFWRDLFDAELMDGNFESADGTVAGGAGAALTPGANLNQYLPEAALSRGNYFTVFSAQGMNFYQLTGVDSIDNTDGSYTLETSLSPQEAFNIDDKVDDGRPVTGVVRATDDLTDLNQGASQISSALTPVAQASVATGDCAHDGATTGGGAAYNTLNDDSANTPSCQMKFRFQ